MIPSNGPGTGASSSSLAVTVPSLTSTPAADAAAACFRNALTCAREQGAHALELRAASSLARWHRKVGEAPVAAAILRPVYARLADVDTLDAVDARQLLETLE